LIKLTEDLKNLGVKSDKKIPDNLLNSDDFSTER